jgi:hypothetical protein
MLGNAFIGILYFLESSLIALLPSGSGFPQGVTDAFVYIGGFIQLVNGFVPLTEIFIVVQAYIVFELIIFTFNSGRFFYNATRGSNI